MVSTPSAAVQASENDKRRKQTQQTMEKVKANHLSRQLQMRLQYARLKVEHGWQKQNLNEVENLYFHNSHLRGPKPFAASTAPIAITQQQPTAFPQPQATSTQSSLSFKLGTSTLGRSSITASLPAENDSKDDNMSHGESSSSHPSQPAFTANPIIPTLSNDLNTRSNLLNDVLSTFAEGRAAPPPTISLNPSIPVQSTANQDIASASTANLSQMKSNTPPQDSESPVDPTPSSTNHYPSIKPSRSRAHRLPAGPKGTHQNLTAKDMVDFSSTSSLTYDSFWSSHTVGTTAVSRSSRGSVATGVAEFAPTFQIPGNFTSGFSELGWPPTHTSFVPSSTSIEQQRSFGGLSQ